MSSTDTSPSLARLPFREPRDVDVRSPSAASPILNRQQCDDLVSTDEPPVAKRHHADIGGPDVVFAHVHIIPNVCSRLRPI